MQYPHIQECYGILWDDITTHIRTIENDELDIFLRDTVHDHVNATLRGNGKGHYVNLLWADPLGGRTDKGDLWSGLCLLRILLPPRCAAMSC